jgi:hypothetical protein
MTDEWEVHVGRQENSIMGCRQITEGCDMKRWKGKGKHRLDRRTHKTVTLACIHMSLFHAQLMLQP